MCKFLGLAAIAAGTLALAQPAAAQDCKAGPFTIYFEFDRNSITPAGAAILDQAAAAYKACGRAEITIAGHTDRRGDESYNIGVSQRMASNVRAYLAGRGVPDGWGWSLGECDVPRSGPRHEAGVTGWGLRQSLPARPCRRLSAHRQGVAGISWR